VKQLATGVSTAASDINRTVEELRPRTAVLAESSQTAQVAAQQIADANGQQATTAVEMSRVIHEANDLITSVGTGIQQLTSQGEALSGQITGLAQVATQVDAIMTELRQRTVTATSPPPAA